MTKARIKKALGHIDDLLHALENDRGVGPEMICNARDSYRYLLFVHESIAELDGLTKNIYDRAYEILEFCAAIELRTKDEPKNCRL